MKPRFYAVLSFYFYLLFGAQNLWAQLEFIENQGQWPGSYGLRAKLNHGDFWLTGNKVSFVLSDFGQKDAPKSPHHHGNVFESNEHCYEMEFVGASANARLIGGDAKPWYHNYFISNDSKTWKSNVPLYGQATHKDIYPGTDLVWQDEKGSLKYEFRLKPGVSAKQIKVRYKGLDNLHIKDNELILKTSLGTIKEGKPIAYQEINGKRVTVECRFVRSGDNTIGFRFPQGYDLEYGLVIDPVLIFSSFSGSRTDNWGFSATYGENGTAYAAGIALGTRFPITTGAFQQHYAGDSTGINIYSTFDISILKFSATGSQLLFATYLGGSEAESPSSIVTDNQGNLIVLGASGSPNFPTTLSAYDKTYNGGVLVSPYGPDESIVQFRQGSDIIVSKFSPNGTQLLGSTYLGGNQNDGVLELIALGNSPLVRNYGDAFRGEVAVDSLGNIFIASHTKSANFPKVQSLQASNGGKFDAVCAKLNPNCSSLLFSTVLGGSQDDGAFSLQLEKNGSVVLTGGTASSNFPASSGTLHPTFQGDVDGFVCRFTPGSGPASYRGTFLGTNLYDQSYFVQLDQKRNIYLYGQSKGNYPIVGNVYQNTGGKQFIHCLSPTLDTTRFSTVFGTNSGTTNISPTAFLVDDCGRIYLSGWGGFLNNIGGFDNGNTIGLPVTPDAYRTTTDGGDFYLMVLEPHADSLSFATFFGDNGGSLDHVDGGTSRFDKKGVVYQSVCACGGAGSTFPTTPGVVSGTNQSNNCNNALFKYDFSLLKSKFQSSVLQGCAPLTVKFTSTSTFALSYAWNFGDGFLVNGVADTISHLFDTAGTFSVQLTAINPGACPATSISTQSIVVQKIPLFSNQIIPLCSESDTLTLSGLPVGPYTYGWAPPQYLSATTIRQPKVQNPDSTVKYTATVTSSFGCKRFGSYVVSDRRLQVSAQANTIVGCKPLKVDFLAQHLHAKLFTWYWGNGDSTVVSTDTLSHVFADTGSIQVVVKVFNDTTCARWAYDTLAIRVEDAPQFNDSSLSFCTPGETLNVSWLPQNTDYSYAWTPPTFLSSNSTANPQILQPDTTVLYSATITTSRGCKRTRNFWVFNRVHQAKASADTLKGCIPFAPNFSNQSYHGGNYSWLWSATDSTASNQPNVSHTFTTVGVFPVILHSRNDTACQMLSADTLIVQTFSLPVFADTLLRYCQDGSYSLRLPKNKGIQFSWQPGGFLDNSLISNPTMTVVASQVFNVTIADTNQCNYTGKVMLRDGRLKAGFSYSLPDSCAPVAVLLANQALNPQQTTWYWNGDSATVSGTNNYTFQANVRGNYVVGMRVRSDTSCSTDDYAERTIAIGGIGLFDLLTIKVCRGDSALVQVPYQAGWRYSWPPTAFPFGDSSTARVHSPGIVPNPFLVQIQDSLGCEGEQSVGIIPFRPPAFITPISRFDPCTDALQYVLRGPGLPGNQYQWQVNGQSLTGDSVEIQFPTRGQYPATLVASEGNCADTITREITVADPPLSLSADFQLTPNAADCQSIPQIITRNLSTGATVYKWEWTGGISEEANPVIIPYEKGLLVVTLKAGNGQCERASTQQLEIYPFRMPNLITPDHNGMNDSLIIENLPPHSTVEIRNRWGEKVYRSENYQNNWIPPDDFGVGFYFIQLPNGKSCSSWLKSSK